MKRRWLVLALTMGAVGSTACSDALIGPRPATDNASLFDEVWRQFDLHYSFFDLKGINWDSLGAYYRPQAVSASSTQQFASVLSRMLAELKDVHVSLTPAGSVGTMRYTSPAEIVPTYYDAGLVTRRYLASPRTTSGGHVSYGLLTPAVSTISWTEAAA